MMEKTEKSVEINAPVEVVFDLFSDFEKFPQWMKHIKEVRQTEPGFTRWTADAPLGINVEWEAETTALEPNQRIAWRTVRGDVQMEGEVTFEELEGGKTMLHVSLGYEPPAGHLGSLLAKLFGTDPDKQIDEELQRFVTLAESQSKKSASRSKKARSRQRRRSAASRAA
jgi:uncharacterized membrane protein